MNSTSTLDDLRLALSQSKGFTERFSEKFIIEFFKAIEEGLRDSRKVSVKGLGTFSANDDGEVQFIPEEALASRINEPFECFSPIQLSDDEADAMRNSNQVIDSTTDVDSSPSEVINAADENPEPTIEATDDETPSLTESSRQDEDSDSCTPDSLSEDYDVENGGTQPDAKSKKSKRGLFFIIGFLVGVIVGITLGYFIFVENTNKPSSIPDNEPNGEAEIQANGTITESIKPAEPSAENKTDSIVTETVTSTNYLASMARRHYGRFEFWVYIYEENKDKLNHPDFIEPNTVVVIPPAEKYDINSNDPESIRRAEAKAKEIYSMYKK